MIKINYKEEIKESELDLLNCKKEIEHAKSLERLEILIWLKKGQIKTMKEAVLLKSKSTEYGRVLWKKYKSKGLASCLNVNYNPRQSPLSDKKELEKRLSEEGFRTIKEAQQWILETYGLEYTENGLGNYFKSRGTKLKTGRPTHPDRDEEKRSAYKKNMMRS